MFDTTYTSSLITKWLFSFKQHFMEFAYLISVPLNDNPLELNLSDFYNNCTENNAFKNAAEERSFEISTTYNMFVKSWPLYNYLDTLQHICSRLSVVKTIIKNAEPEQIHKLEQSIINIIPGISIQNALLQLFRQTKEFSDFMLSLWNQAQTELFDNLILFYQTSAELYFNECSIYIRPLLLSISNAPKLLEFMFGENSKFLCNSIENINKKRKYSNIYFWVRMASVFLSFAAACFIWLGNQKYRDIYVLILVLAVGAFFGSFIHKKYQESLVKTGEEEARLYVQHTNPGCAFNPVMEKASKYFQPMSPVDALSNEMLALEIGY